MKPLRATHIIALITLSQLSSSHQEFCGEALVVQVSNETRKATQIHFPWAGALYSFDNNKTIPGDIKYLCGASLVSMSFSVTAAHCIHDKSSERRSPDDLAVYFGIYDLKQKNATGSKISELFIHKDWNPIDSSYDSDIAILRLRNALTLSKKVLPICLWPATEEVVDNEIGTVISWTDPDEDAPGYWNYEHDSLHNFPRTFKMPIRSNTECFLIQPRFKAIASDNSFCGGGLNSGPCLEIGNSGASMAIENGESFFLRGIVSASFIDFAGCDNVTFTLFTDVRRYKSWITDIIQTSE